MSSQNNKKNKQQKWLWFIIAIFIIGNINIVSIFTNLPNDIFKVNEKKIIKSYKQYTKVKEVISTENKVGFITDIEPNQVFKKKDSFITFHELQIAITPIILENYINNKYVIGVFKSNSAQIPKDLVIYKNLGGGVIIFKNRTFND